MGMGMNITTQKEPEVSTRAHSVRRRPSLANRSYLCLAAVVALVPLATACDEPLPEPMSEPASITLNVTTLALTSLGDTARLSAEVYDQNGQLMADYPVSWSTSDTAVASVTQAGLVRAEGNGMASITATAGSASAAASVSVVVVTDREALTALYNATGGRGWTNRNGWLSDAPLSRWHGVKTDAEGRVVELELVINGLSGVIPPEIGHLTKLRVLHLHYNELTGAIPPEIGKLTELEELLLHYNDLTSIPPEIGNLGRLRKLFLYLNHLSGSIPPEIGKLGQLRQLGLAYNDLTGTIPREIGNLLQLRDLFVESNKLSGSLPPEIGNLTELRHLWLHYNAFSGSIPPELGNLAKLEQLRLDHNGFTGSVPGDLGGMTELTLMFLHDNKLSGDIPEEFSNLPNLTDLWMGGNDFDGPFPVALTQLPSVDRLMLVGNPYSGTLPEEIGDMANLTTLLLTDSGLSGELPLGMTRLDSLSELMLGGTELCVPAAEAFQRWLEGVAKRRIPPCEGPEDGSAAYLTQTVQSMAYPVPLVAGEDALLRVFVVAPAAAGDTIPLVRATFYLEGQEAGVVDIARGSSIIGERVNEGSLQSSANALISASLVQPGLEMVVEIDPDGAMDPELGVARRIPSMGRMELNVRAMPTLELTLIPFLWSQNPDSAILDITGDLAPGDQLLSDIRNLLPVADMDLTIHEPVAMNTNNAFALLEETGTIRAAEGGTGYYMGTMSGPVYAALGVAYVPGWTSFSIPDSSVMAHELGHNLNLWHAPCGGAGSLDVSFPQSDGTLGAWGYDFSKGRLVRPATRDLMTYCDPTWISEFHYTNALHHRLVAEPTLSLLISGGVDADERPYLRPAFVIDAPPTLPRAGGPYRLSGVAASGAELFSLSFEMPVIAGEDNRSSFAFAVPAQSGWADDLVRITLSGPDGSVALDGNTDRPAVIVRNPRTGQVRGIFTELPAGITVVDARGGLIPIESGLEVLFSRGIPAAAAWSR